MKNFSIILLAMLITIVSTQSCIAQAKVFNEAAKIEGVTSIYISPTLLKLGARHGNLGHGLDDAIQELSALEIINYDSSAKLAQVKATCRKVIEQIEGETMLEVNDDGDKVTIFAKVIPNTDYAELIVIEVDESDEYTVIYVKGKINLKKVAEEYD